MRVSKGIGAAVLYVLSGACPGCFAEGPLRLERALQSAVVKSAAGDTLVALPAAQVRLAEALNRTRFEFRPQMGLYSFSHPALIASSLGASFLFSRPTPASRFALQNARLDLLDAKLNHASSKLRTEMETARVFFDLLERQHVAERACQNWQRLQERAPSIDKLVQAARLTALDRGRFEAEQLDREADCVEADTQRKITALRLASLTGLGEAGTLRVQDTEDFGLEARFQLASIDELLSLALRFRTEPALIREEISGLAREIGRSSPAQPLNASLTYLNNRDSGLGSARAGSYWLGGNTVHPELSWNIPLRKTGERAASREVLTIKLKRLEAQLAAMEEEIRNDIATSRILAASGLRKVTIARNKLEVSSRVRQMLTTRFQHGLGTSAVLFEAERDELSAQARFMQADYETRAGLFEVMMLCGLNERPREEQQRMLWASARSSKTE